MINQIAQNLVRTLSACRVSRRPSGEDQALFDCLIYTGLKQAAPESIKKSVRILTNIPPCFRLKRLNDDPMNTD